MLPVKLWFINVYTYPNPKPTPYSNANTLIMRYVLWLEGIKLWPETNNKYIFMPIRLFY